MTDRPIIFSAPMVRALLDGRKTQTRRVLKHKEINIGIAPTVDENHPYWIQFHHPHGGPLTCIKWPYAPGDRLWVREVWGLGLSDHGDCPRYRATMAGCRTTRTTRAITRRSVSSCGIRGRSGGGGDG